MISRHGWARTGAEPFLARCIREAVTGQRRRDHIKACASHGRQGHSLAPLYISVVILHTKQTEGIKMVSPFMASLRP